MLRTYSELCSIQSLKERFEYLKLDGSVGLETFGFNRYLNQSFYTSYEWQKFRRDVILRDLGNELALDGYPINGTIIIHHLNPIVKQNLLDRDSCLFDLENVVCVSLAMHNAIHYSDYSLVDCDIVERFPNDTKLW